MESLNTLRPGRAFEKEVFGVTEEGELVLPRDYPKSFGFDESMQYVIEQTWSRYAKLKEQGLDYYDPTDPKIGKTGLLFQAVKKHLPRRVGGKLATKLHLYISVGRNSLDWYHGVDAFFWWEGCFITIDASLGKKTREEMRAEFLMNPRDLEGDRLGSFGKEIANRLKKRRLFNKSKKKTVSRFRLEDVG